MPSIDILKPQGINRFIAKVHQNQEYTTASGLVVANTEATQTIPTTGEVIATTKVFGYDDKGNHIFPDIKPGMCVKVTMNGWSSFWVDGELFAIGDARCVIAAYDPKDIV